jgi:hypothetical protein
MLPPINNARLFYENAPAGLIVDRAVLVFGHGCFVKPIQVNPVPSILSRFRFLDVLAPSLPNGEGLGPGHQAVRQPGPIEAPASEAWNEITDKAGHPHGMWKVGVYSCWHFVAKFVLTIPEMFFLWGAAWQKEPTKS